jgi:hypothetical protein
MAAVALLGFGILVWDGRWDSVAANPQYEGRTMAEWLRILASEHHSSSSPLDIVRVHEETSSHSTFLEVPLSYRLLREHDFFDGIGKITFLVDGGARLPKSLRETNGNCLLELDWDREGIRPGAHKVEVEFEIWLRTYNRLHAMGSARTIAFNKRPISQ